MTKDTPMKLSGKKIVVTGGAGFIGSELCSIIVEHGGIVLNIDNLTYAGSLDNTENIAYSNNYQFSKSCIGSNDTKEKILSFCPQYIFNLAAESHVDNSINDPQLFVETNVLKTTKFFSSCLSYWQQASENNIKLVHVSTDEVFGALSDGGVFNEHSPIQPSSPYSSSKASSDLIALSFYKTFGLPVVVTNCSNNFGIRQHPEKLIPKAINCLKNGEKIPVYGNGNNIRDWINVSDHCYALIKVAENGNIGERYCIGGANELSNIQLLSIIIREFNQLTGLAVTLDESITFVDDRLGHDYRYAIDNGKITNELQWLPSTDFNAQIRETVEYYLCKS